MFFITKCSNVFWPLFRIWRVCWLFNEASDTAGNYAAGCMLGNRILCPLGAGHSTSIWRLWKGSNQPISAEICAPTKQTYDGEKKAKRWPGVVDLPALFVHLCWMPNPTCLMAKGASLSVWCVKQSKTEEVMGQMYSVHAFRQHARHCCLLPRQAPSPPPHPLDLTQREVRMIEDNFVSHRVDRDMTWHCGGNGGLEECLKKTEGM